MLFKVNRGNGELNGRFIVDVGKATGPQGIQGPQGISGTMVETVPFNQWPPADPQPNTLYLKLTP